MYESCLWYYDAMLFLQYQETPAPSRSWLNAETERCMHNNNNFEQGHNMSNNCRRSLDVIFQILKIMSGWFHSRNKNEIKNKRNQFCYRVTEKSFM